MTRASHDSSDNSLQRRSRKLRRAGISAFTIAVMLGIGGLVAAQPATSASITKHVVFVYVQPDVASVFYSTVEPAGVPFTACRKLAPHNTTTWLEGGQTVVDGKPVTMITFSSDNCTNGYMKRFDRTAPDQDGLVNWWVDLR
jgi:hypothetical protein